MKYLYLVVLLSFCISCNKSDDSTIVQGLKNTTLPCDNQVQYGDDISTALNFPVINDPSTSIFDVALISSCLYIEYRFSGGCENHELDLFLFSHPLVDHSGEVFLAKVSHNNTDPCEALLSQIEGYDLSSLSNLGFDEVTIEIEGWDDLITINL